MSNWYDLFQFATFAEQFRGWGRGLRNAIGNWYEQSDADRLAYQLVKYRQRDGWTHRDLLRLAHPKGASAVHSALYDWVTQESASEILPDIVEAFLTAQHAESAEEVAGLVRDFNLPREALPTEYLSAPVVWEALLENMPATALIRNLGNMTRIGLVTPTSTATKTVLAKLEQGDWLRKSRVHPLSVLVALKTYESGGGYRSSNTWAPVASIVDALDGAFYAAFGNVESTGKRFLMGLDVSGLNGCRRSSWCARTYSARWFCCEWLGRISLSSQ